MNKLFIICATTLALSACNSISYEPQSLMPETKVYSIRGGYSMKRSAKLALTKRGFDVVVGRAKAMGDDSERVVIPDDAIYVLRVAERREKFNPFWCPLNGFWWWNFNMSIADQETGTELLLWRGRGCADSSIRKLNKILDDMLIKQPETVD